jgi:monofunctional biosynthetic peptidoglycan transglycosylase
MAKRRTLTARILHLLLGLALLWLSVTVLIVGALRWIDPPTSAFMLSERLTHDRAVQQQWVDWDRISAPMKVAVIAAEDQTFPDHWGFDFKSIDQALSERERGRVRGASTISQQVAKNLFLWNGRSWVRKGLEAYFTLLLETLWPKQRILEIYLNIAEFGPGIYGVEAAGRTFFRKPAAQLSIAESALLAAVLPNPKRLRANAPSAYVRTRQAWIMGQMIGLGGPTMVLQRIEKPRERKR